MLPLEKSMLFGRLSRVSFHGEMTRLIRVTDLPIDPEMDRPMGGPLFKERLKSSTIVVSGPSAIPSSTKETLPPWRITDPRIAWSVLGRFFLALPPRRFVDEIEPAALISLKLKNGFFERRLRHWIAPQRMEESLSSTPTVSIETDQRLEIDL